MSSPLTHSANPMDGARQERDIVLPPIVPAAEQSVRRESGFVLKGLHSRNGQSNGNYYGNSLNQANGRNDEEKNDSQHELEMYRQLSQNLSDLLNRTDISDCVLNCKGTFMAVHKCILAARSNVFAAVFSGNYNGSGIPVQDQLETTAHKDKLVIIINKTDPQIMKQVVIFMYTSRCDLHEGNAYALLDAAGRYDIKSLKVHTGRYLAARVNSNNILPLLEAANKYDNKLLKQSCIEHFVNHAKEIMEMHELWKQFATRQQALVGELLHWLVNKDKFLGSKPQWDTLSHWQ